MNSRPGRNEPCPCGSGKKFKKCHGRSGASPAPLQPPTTGTIVGEKNIDALATLDPDQTSASVPLEGFPGQHQQYVVVNEFADATPSVRIGLAGEYKVIFVLSRPGRAPRADRDVSFKLGPEGDSHLSINAKHVLPAGTEEKAILAVHLDSTHAGRTVRLLPPK